MAKRRSYKIATQQTSFLDSDTPSMPVFDKSRCEARLINYETAARMVETYHYAHRVPSIVVAVGMFVDGILAGVCTYGLPPNPNLCRAFGEDNFNNVLELNRLFVFDGIGANSESWLVGQSYKFLPSPQILISYADTEQSHIGYIYQALNWLYVGLSERGGVQSDVILNGQRLSPKAVHNRYGSVVGLDLEKTQWFPKYRYVYFLGNRCQRRELRTALKWPVLSYPKS